MVAKVLLSETDPRRLPIVEVQPGNGYVSGGAPLPDSGEVVFAALGGNVGPFRYAVVYDADGVVESFDYGMPITLRPGHTFTVSDIWSAIAEREGA